MNKAAAKDRIAKLRDLINDYRYNYHVLDRSTMSEAAADSLKHELSQLEEKFPELITPDSPSQRVAGLASSRFTQVAHSRRMLSLNDVFDESEVAAWAVRVEKFAGQQIAEFFADIKMDGFACALIYQDGVLQQAITRGDGFVGEDVTTNVRTIESVPLALRCLDANTKHLCEGRLEVRGEIIMLKSDFELINAERKKQNLPLYANPRNLAAGTIRQLDPRLVAERPLQFRAYDVITADPNGIATHAEAYALLTALGFVRNQQAEVLKSTQAIMEFAEKWEHKRLDLPFGTDGLVVKVNNRRIYERLGVVGKAPRAAVAYKFPAEQATTKVKDIFISIGRTGAATPVAMLEPVLVAGSTVQMATLHNEGEVLRKDIRVGDTVIIHKAGDIIPEVVESLKTLRTGKEPRFEMPKECPECGIALVKLKEDDAVWRCPNTRCPARVHNQIQHYASKAAMDIDGMGEKNVLALLDAGLISDIADLYTLTFEQVRGLDRFADISAQKLIDAIHANMHPTLGKFLYALGIRHIGQQTAEDLANHFHTLDALRAATIEQLHEVEGIGEVVAESIVAWFASEEDQALLQKLLQVGVEPQKAEAPKGPLVGKAFVVTGSLESMDRDQAADLVRQAGGVFQSSLGKQTDYLVVGKSVGASKIARAEKLGTARLTEEEFLKMVGKK